MFRLLVLLTVATLAAAIFDNEIDEKYNTLPEDKFIEYFNNQNFTWKIRHHKHLEGRRLTGVIRRENYKSQIAELPVIEHYRSRQLALLKGFDSRRNWPKCDSIKQIYDQGDCGSCWTFGAATVMSDRTCIHAKISVRLSEQDFNCLHDSGVCCGGEPLDAFKFWQNYGLVTQDCLPYNITALHMADQCNGVCTNKNIDYSKDKHYGDKVYTISKVGDDIKAEIIKNGPIEASFVVYEDFQYYSCGVYTHRFGKMVGAHSVRIIGFGTEKGEDYWLVANSWGKDWGDNGYVKIKTFQEDLEFEDHLITGLPYY